MDSKVWLDPSGLNKSFCVKIITQDKWRYLNVLPYYKVNGAVFYHQFEIRDWLEINRIVELEQAILNVMKFNQIGKIDFKRDIPSCDKVCLCPKELYKVYGLNINTQAVWRTKKKIPYIKIRRKVFYLVSDIDSWILTLKMTRMDG